LHLRKKFNFETAGIDLSEFLLKTGADRVPDLRLIKGNGESLPFRDSSFNGVIAECSLSVMDDPALVLNEIFRILKPGGKFAMSDVCLQHPEFAENIRKLPLKGCLAGAFIYDELVSMLIDAGFHLLVHEEHSNLWKEFVAGLILNNACICDIIFCGCSVRGRNSIMMPEIVKARPGYFSIIAEKR
jgi:ubiquinone/menaquinone biosynthesis C-methylase UbiE